VTVRRRRNPANIVYAGGYKAGNVVVVTSSAFNGKKTGIVVDPVKSCTDGIPVYLADDTIVTRLVCIRSDNGDTIEKISK
jgi:hypothetical protein